MGRSVHLALSARIGVMQDTHEDIAEDRLDDFMS